MFPMSDAAASPASLPPPMMITWPPPPLLWHCQKQFDTDMHCGSLCWYPQKWGCVAGPPHQQLMTLCVRRVGCSFALCWTAGSASLAEGKAARPVAFSSDRHFRHARQGRQKRTSEGRGPTGAARSARTRRRSAALSAPLCAVHGERSGPPVRADAAALDGIIPGQV